MAHYFPSLLRDQRDAGPILNSLITLDSVGKTFAINAAARVIQLMLTTAEGTSLGPIGWLASAVQTALFIVELFSQPTRIDIQKDVVESYFDPLTHFLALNYCYPISGGYFKILESDEVHAALARRPDLAELRDTMYPQARDLVSADVGLGGYGSHMNERIVNQCLGNWERHGWSTQQVIDGWQGILNAAEVGPQPNGPPPPDSAAARAIAGQQVGARLYNKWITRAPFALDEWQMFADFYVQKGFDTQAAIASWGQETSMRWDAVFYSPWQENRPIIPAPQVLTLPQAVAYFSPPCLQTGNPYQEQAPPPPPGPQPGPTRYQRACQYWTLRYSGQAIPPDLAIWVTQEENYAAVAESSIDPHCGYQQPGPQPPPQPPPNPWPQPEPDPRNRPQPPPPTPWPQPPYNPWPQPDPSPRGQPQPPPPNPQPWLQPSQLACQYWTLWNAHQPIPDWLLAWATDLRNAEAMLQASHDPNCGYRQPDPPPPTPQPPTSLQQACQYWLLLRAHQPISPELQRWVADPQNYPALAQAFCDPACGYNPEQPWPPPPDPQPPKPPDDQCPTPCQDQIDDLKDRVQRTRPPWQNGCHEWPPRSDDQDCWQWPWPQQPWPPRWPQPWPCEWPPGWPQPPCTCPPPQPCTCICPPPGPPPIEPPEPPTRPPRPPTEECPPEDLQNFWECIWPHVRDRICEIAKECQRQLDCVRIRWCEIARTQMGSMLECWALADTPEAHGPVEVGLIAQTPGEILTYVDQATNPQRSGLYARGVGIALAAQATLLAKQFPHFDDEPESPTPIGFGVKDEQTQLQIVTVRPHLQERNPCQDQGIR